MFFESMFLSYTFGLFFFFFNFLNPTSQIIYLMYQMSGAVCIKPCEEQIKKGLKIL